MCSHECPNELGLCSVIKNNGTPCQRAARRSHKGVNTCLVHAPRMTCSICLEGCPVGTNPTICGHFFHSTCMEEWEKQSNGNTCPMCRFVLSTPPQKKVPNEDLVIRVRAIAEASENRDEFMANVANLTTAEELELILDRIRSEFEEAFTVMHVELFDYARRRWG